MRAHKLMVRLNDDEKMLLDHIAEAHDLPTATWSRRQLLRTARSEREASQDEAHLRNGSLDLLSLFCGPGGLDQGFEDAGFHTQLAIDIDPKCIITFRANHPTAKATAQDITALTLEELDSLAGQKVKPVGVLGGPPCQSFSVSNVHQKDSDPRHRLPMAYATLLRELNSRHPLSFFVFENVPGLLGRRHRHRYEEFKRQFEAAGFTLYETLLDAKHYGVPQERKRVIIVGINEDKHPGAIWVAPLPERRIRTVRETIGDLPEPVYNSPGLDPATFPVHPNHWCLVPRSSKFVNAKLHEGQMYGRSFRTLYWDRPSWTVAYGHREVHVHPKGHRRLSIFEALLLQSFPRSYKLTGNMTDQIRLVSEAVPPRLAWHIARSIRQSLGI